MCLAFAVQSAVLNNKRVRARSAKTRPSQADRERAIRQAQINITQEKLTAQAQMLGAAMASQPPSPQLATSTGSSQVQRSLAAQFSGLAAAAESTANSGSSAALDKAGTKLPCAQSEEQLSLHR